MCLCCHCCCLCCLRVMTPKCLEIGSLILNVVEIACLIWGLAAIPFGFLPNIGKVMLILSLVVMIIGLLVTIAEMVLRYTEKVNTSANLIGKILIICLIICIVLSLLFLIIGEYKILRNMIDTTEFYDEYSSKIEIDFTIGEWLAAALATSLFEFLALFHIMFAACLLNLIFKKTDLSYERYNYQKEEQNKKPNNGTENATTVDVINPPNNNLGLNVPYPQNQIANPIPVASTTNTNHIVNNMNPNDVKANYVKNNSNNNV